MSTLVYKRRVSFVGLTSLLVDQNLNRCEPKRGVNMVNDRTWSLTPVQ